MSPPKIYSALSQWQALPGCQSLLLGIVWFGKMGLMKMQLRVNIARSRCKFVANASFVKFLLQVYSKANKGSYIFIFQSIFPTK